jgi:hypothetical protein
MVTAPTADELYASAAKFAQSALDAHHKGDHQRVAIDAGTALEHLTKACLANRSPALLAELKSGPSNWASLALLSGFPEGEPKQLRTVGLRDAHIRLRTFVSSVASETDLALLINLRDGAVHAALNDEVEERLLVAFVQEAEVMLADLNKSRSDFWADWLDMVDALVADATDKVRHRVQLKLATAKAAFAGKYSGLSDEVRNVIKMMTPSFDERHEAIADCPACGSQSVASGGAKMDTHPHPDGVSPDWVFLVFAPVTLSCHQCGLRLTSQAVLTAAGVPDEWVLPGLDGVDYVAWDRGEDFG